MVIRCITVPYLPFWMTAGLGLGGVFQWVGSDLAVSMFERVADPPRPLGTHPDCGRGRRDRRRRRG